VSPASEPVSAYKLASLLLQYPTAPLFEGIDALDAAAAGIRPRETRHELQRFLGWLRQTPPTEVAQHYVETFDLRRRACLHLTYYAHGDTRKRGMALLRFKQTYLRSGFVLEEHGGELPDHLCVVLEYAATVDRRLGWRLLLDHRASLELLRLSLRDAGSLWTGAVEAVCATLPRVRADEADLVRKLVEEGPPAEEVGLTPYGEPAFDGRLEAALMEGAE